MLLTSSFMACFSLLKRPLGNNEASCMFGSHGAALVVDALAVGLNESSGALHSEPTCWHAAAVAVAEAVQPALLQMATENVPINGRSDLQHYLGDGFQSSCFLNVSHLHSPQKFSLAHPNSPPSLPSSPFLSSAL